MDTEEIPEELDKNIIGPSITKPFANKFQIQIENESDITNELNEYSTFKLPNMIIKKSQSFINVNSPRG